MNQTQYDVLIVGAGMAGLTAARELSAAGLTVIVLEAADRIGGRIRTERVREGRSEAEVIELGAEFVHGNPPELWALIAEAGLSTYARQGSQICLVDNRLEECGERMQQAFEPLDALEEFAGPDVSFAEYLDQQQTPFEQRGPAIGYVEGFNAADHCEISALSLGAQQRAEDSIDGDSTFCLSGGYDQLPAFLATNTTAQGGRIELATPVRAIRWSKGSVEAATDHQAFTARQAVITLPLALLQQDEVDFSPRPAGILEAAALMRMGQVVRFTFVFRERFWATLAPEAVMNEMSFLFTFSAMPPVWWTPHPKASHTLTGWVGGPRCVALAGLSASQLGIRACEALSRIFSLDEAHLSDLYLDCHTHDWQQDPFARGAYSYVGVGGMDASARMAEPVEHTLYFAGEHTDTTGHWGTVHAALRSGLRAASQILAERGLNP